MVVACKSTIRTFQTGVERFSAASFTNHRHWYMSVPVSIFRNRTDETNREPIMPRPAEFKDKPFKHTIFLKIAEAIQASADSDEAPIALHVGDTWCDLPEELLTPLPEEPWNERLSRYGNTRGETELRRRLAAKLREQNKLPVSSPDEVQIVFGATGGLYLAMQKLLEPGDEVIVLSPQWTIFRVVASTARVRIVEAPFFHRIADEPDGNLAAWIEPFLSERTRAIYFNNPNNPSGVMMLPEHIEQVASFAVEHDLWVFSDEAYEDFVWINAPYVSIGSLPGMYERTVSVFSFSKSYAAAGLRLGYVAAPPGVIAALNPGHVGVGYEPNRSSQVEGIRGLERSAEVVGRLQKLYREGRQAALESIKVPHLPAEGSFYLFLDLRDRWKGLSDDQKLERMLSAGVICSPGAPFGEAYDGFARFCYTSEPPEKVAEAARRTADL
ncbi:aminotransferase class I/II-fold pyridoxal phosphate-dependent enzyme [bacterium]|nr:aminotransferase class I/II-fold pyridoxal phosphate-dependent enzyme [bacterium]